MSDVSTEELLRRARLLGRIAHWCAVTAILFAVVAIVVSLVSGPQVTVTLR